MRNSIEFLKAILKPAVQERGFRMTIAADAQPQKGTILPSYL